jgi:hypothetical protein
LTLALPKIEDRRFLVPPKIFVSSLSSGSEMLPNLGVGGIFLDSDIVMDNIVKNGPVGSGRVRRRRNYSTDTGATYLDVIEELNRSSMS